MQSLHTIEQINTNGEINYSPDILTKLANTTSDKLAKFILICLAFIKKSCIISKTLLSNYF